MVPALAARWYDHLTSGRVKWFLVELRTLEGYSSYAFMANGLQASTIAGHLSAGNYFYYLRVKVLHRMSRTIDASEIVWRHGLGARKGRHAARSNACGGLCGGRCSFAASPRRLGGAPEVCVVVGVGRVLFLFYAEVGDVCVVREAGSGGIECVRRCDVALF